MALKEPVAKAIEEIRKAYPANEVLVREDGQGGAYVIVESVDLSETHQPAATWIGFRITFQYPYADVYPHYVRADLDRLDGVQVRKAGVQPNQQFEGRAALQLSRRSSRLDPTRDTALRKLSKVLLWLRETT